MAYDEEYRRNELARIDRTIREGPYRADWDSLSAWQAPDWYRDAKFGVFTHWGLYTVPEHDNEWYSRNMYIEGTEAFRHHVQTYGPQDRFGYKDFIPLFRGERFDPEEWCGIVLKRIRLIRSLASKSSLVHQEQESLMKLTIPLIVKM